MIAEDINDYDKLQLINLEASLAKRKKQIQFVNLYKQYKNVGKCCDSLEITRQNFINWRNRDAEFRVAIESIDEGFLDNMEDRLRDIAQQDDKLDTALRATTTILEAKAKSRGYGKQLLDSNVTVNILHDLQKTILADSNNYIDVDEVADKTAKKQLLDSNVDSGLRNRSAKKDEFEDVEAFFAGMLASCKEEEIED